VKSVFKQLFALTSTKGVIMELTQPEAVGFSAARLQRINTVMARYVEEQKFAGIVTLIARRGRVVHFEAVGQQEIATGQPMRTDTLFRIYSMTKPITTVAAMMLYEQGYFRLSDPVATYLPAFGETPVLARAGPLGLELTRQAPPMTIRDLMTHTAGLSYGFFVDSPVELLYQRIHNVTDFEGHPTLYPTDRTLGETVDQWAKLPLLHQPGGAFRYSVATDVLGRLIEVISDQPLEEFIRKQILQPLGMTETAYHVPPDKVARFAAMYTPAEQGLRAFDPPATSPYARPQPMQPGGAGLVATAADYLRFCQMLLNGGVLDGVRLLGRKTVAFMTANHIPAAQLPLRHGDEQWPGEGFGLGFGVILDPAANGCPWSAGTFYWGGAANTTFWIDPQEALIGILMTQFMPASTYPLNDDFRLLTYQALVE
jgi:CubicO group peptidase (beta-lactamase class C family)